MCMRVRLCEWCGKAHKMKLIEMIAVDFVFEELWSEPKHSPPDISISLPPSLPCFFFLFVSMSLSLFTKPMWKKNKTQHGKLGVFVVWWIGVLLGSHIPRRIEHSTHQIKCEINTIECWYVYTKMCVGARSFPPQPLSHNRLIVTCSLKWRENHYVYELELVALWRDLCYLMCASVRVRN